MSVAADPREARTAAPTLSQDGAPAAPAQETSEKPTMSSIPFPLKEDGQKNNGAKPSAAMPPAMASVKLHTADEVLDMMNRTPLFMTSLDETDGAGGDNVELEAIKALAYEGTRAEVAGNFKEQGNEMAKVKRWVDAREYYTRAVASLKAPRKPQEQEEGPADMGVVQIDEEAEKEKEKAIEEACYVNRALCNLEMKNYRSCISDCASTLRLNPRNVKAYYRCAQACLALDKIAEAEDACDRGLAIYKSNAALRTLSAEISKRKEHLNALERVRRDREERTAAETRTLAMALKARNIRTRTTKLKPDLEDAEVKLEKPLDTSSTLSFPAVLLYPLHAQSDFIKAFAENESLVEHLSYIFPLPWDESGEYRMQNVGCYAETISGGLLKVGKKLPLVKILGTGKVEVVDGMVRLFVVPKEGAAGWIAEFKKRKGG